MDIPASQRDGDGRFAPGNPGGPGRSKGRGYELQRAAQEAITPEQMGVMMRKALRMALEGNLAAMRFVAERTCGRAPEASPEAVPLDFTLPKLQTPANCTAAIDRLADAITQGTVDRDTAKMVLDVIQARLKAIEVNDLEQRLVELEKASTTVDLPGSRRR